MRKALIPAVLTSAAWAAPALACTDPPEAFDRSISDRVVEGSMRCDPGTDRCLVSVARSLKPRDMPRLEERALVVQSEYGTRAAWAADNVLVLSCPGPFGPEQTEFFGRFYLILDDATGLYRVRRYYVRDRDGAFYHLGIRCGPWTRNEVGNLSQTCDSVGAE